MAISSFATSEEGLSKLESQVTCVICLECYRDPRTLPCLHSFCKDCIGHLPVEQDEGRHLMRCPSCRSPTQLSERGAAALPTAFHINNLLEIHQLLKKTDSQSIPLCHIHKDKLDIYCETCEEHVCFNCSTGSHRDHQCERAESLFKKHKQEVEQCRPIVKKKIKEVEQALACFSTRERERKEQEEAMQKEIDEHYEQLVKKLKKEVDENYEQLVKNLKQSREKLRKVSLATLEEKIQLHSLHKAHVEAVLMQLKSCHEFLELESQSEYQIQAAKKQVVQLSKMEVSKLQPACPWPDSIFVPNLNTLDACNNIGNIKRVMSFSSPGLFSVSIPAYNVVNRQVEVLLTAPIPFSAEKLVCQVYKYGQPKIVKCPVTSIGEGQFMIMIPSGTTSTAGIWYLAVFVDKHSIYDSPFSVRVDEWKRNELVIFSKAVRKPWGIAVTNDGKYVVVTDTESHCVVVLSSAGEELRRFGGRHVSFSHESAKFNHPVGVAVSADKHLYVVDYERLQKFTFSSLHETSIPLRSSGVAIHPTSGKVLCGNTFYGRKIDVLNDDLTFSNSFGETCFTFTSPCCLAVDTKGMVYVSDSSRNIILKFTPDGEFLAFIGTEDSEIICGAELSTPWGICIDSNDILYVCDLGNHFIKAYTTEGQYLGKFGRSDNIAFEAKGIAVDKVGNIYVSDDCSSGGVFVSRPL